MTPLPAPPPWLTVSRGEAPLIVSLPHTGIEITERFGDGLVPPWRARRDADSWIDQVYDGVAGLGATVVRTAISRRIIDVNRDPTGASRFRARRRQSSARRPRSMGSRSVRRSGPRPAPIAERRATFFDPCHAAFAAEVARPHAGQGMIVLHDCHSIRSVILRQFEATVPDFKIGTDGGKSCDPRPTRAVAADWSRVEGVRFKGEISLQRFGDPASGTHAIQMELACRTYRSEPDATIREHNLPAPYDPACAAPVRATLRLILEACLASAAWPDAAGSHP